MAEPASMGVDGPPFRTERSLRNLESLPITRRYSCPFSRATPPAKVKRVACGRRAHRGTRSAPARAGSQVMRKITCGPLGEPVGVGHELDDLDEVAAARHGEGGGVAVEEHPLASPRVA